MTYADYVGMMLQRWLPLRWDSAAVCMGLGIAGGQKAHLELFRALYDTEAQAVLAAWEHNAEVQSRKLIADRWGDYEVPPP